jgi:hypothetical protein
MPRQASKLAATVMLEATLAIPSSTLRHSRGTHGASRHAVVKPFCNNRAEIYGSLTKSV